MFAVSMYSYNGNQLHEIQICFCKQQVNQLNNIWLKSWNEWEIITQQILRPHVAFITVITPTHGSQRANQI